MQDSLLSNYICSVPFTSLEILPNSRHLCCASWLLKYLPENTSPYEAWNSKEANEIRDSILNGSYRFCDDNHCPFLNELGKENSNAVNNSVFVKPLHHKSSIPRWLEEKITQHNNRTLAPETVQFSFDRTCNLKCPSCRIDIDIANSRQIRENESTINQIQEQYGADIKTLYITGSGDPFVSVAFRNFLRNFDPSRWPKLQRIHLHTNATKWTKEMWESMPKVHKYIKTCEISIDAATKDTYENKTRLGGDWNSLLENLEFISTIKTLRYIKTSFVVQQSNYKEMKLFYDLMTEIFGDKASVFYGKLIDWGTFSQEEFKAHTVHDKLHPEFSSFVESLNSVLPRKNAWSNLQEFIKKTQRII